MDHHCMAVGYISTCAITVLSPLVINSSCSSPLDTALCDRVSEMDGLFLILLYIHLGGELK